MADMNKSAQVMQEVKDSTIYTWVAQEKYKAPIAIERGEGVFVYDYEGNKYYDMNSQLVNVNHGHNNQAIIKAIQDQAAKLSYCGPRYPYEARAELGKLIMEEVAPKHMKKVLFTLGGADANEYAIRMVRQVTGRNKIFSKWESYHGSTYGSGMLTGEAERSAPFPSIPGFLRFPPAHLLHYDIKFETEEEATAHFLAQMDYMFRMEGTNEVAAVWLESVTGSNGVYLYPKGYLKGVRELCDKYGAMLVCDEVMSGFYRSGPSYFACEREGVEPDIITFAKGVNSGYAPLGGVLVNQRVLDYYADHSLPCGLTYNSHPLGVAAAIAAIKEYKRMDMKSHLEEMGPYFSKKLAELKANHSSILDVRNSGLLGCIEFKTNDRSFMPQIFAKYLEHGLLTIGHHCFTMCSPPLIITKEEMDDMFVRLDKAITWVDEAIKDHQ